jgi:hypothetical protein
MDRLASPAGGARGHDLVHHVLQPLAASVQA